MYKTRYQLQADQWLSEQLDRVSCNMIETRSGVPIEEILATIPSPSFISAKVSADQKNATIELCSSGFFLADVAVTFEIGTSRDLPSSNKDITLATPEDKQETMEVARLSFSYSRFHKDPHIDQLIANRIKMNWVANYFSGRRGTHMLLAKVGAKVVGFIQLIETENAWRVDLIAVLPKFQRDGIGAALLSAIKHIGENKKVIAGTQLCNLKSIRTYQKTGFQLLNAEYVFHRHEVSDKIKGEELRNM